MADKIYIPEVSNEEVTRRFDHIKPVVEFDGIKCHIKPVDLFSTAFTWSPERAKPATGLQPLTDITTYHTWAYYGFFKPTIAEVLKQIPNEYLQTAVAFEIVDSPSTMEDLNKNKDALNAGYHVAVTRLYGKTNV